MKLPSSRWPLGERIPTVPYSPAHLLQSRWLWSRGAVMAHRRPQEPAWTMLPLPLSYWLAVALVVLASGIPTPPSSGAPWGLDKGVGMVSPKDQSGPPPSLSWGPSNVFLLYKNQVQVLPPLPSGSQTAPLFFRAADCESQSLKREAKYIPLVNEEINLFKSCPGGSCCKMVQGRVGWGDNPTCTGLT